MPGCEIAVNAAPLWHALRAGGVAARPRGTGAVLRERSWRPRAPS
jgi:hypothetical protein